MNRLVGICLSLTLLTGVVRAEWDPAMMIGDQGGLFPGRPAMTMSGDDTIHFIYGSSRTGKPEVYYRRSIDRGINWGPDQQLSDASSPRQFNRSRVIAAEGRNVVAAWLEFRGVNDARMQSLWFSRSEDGGDTWSAPEAINPDPAEWTDFPSIAISGRYVHIVWSGSNAVQYRRSTDLGESWEDVSHLASGYVRVPVVTAAGSTVHLTWNASFQDIDSIVHYHRRSDDDGTVWSDSSWLAADPIDRNSTPVSVYENTSLTLDGSNAYFVWSSDQDARSTGYYTDLYLRVSNDEGRTWGPGRRITNYQDNTAARDVAANPSLVVREDGIHVVWDHIWNVISYDFGRFNSKVGYSRSIDGGATWSEEAALSDAFSDNYPYGYPQIISAGSDLHVIWSNPEPFGVFQRIKPGTSSTPTWLIQSLRAGRLELQ